MYVKSNTSSAQGIVPALIYSCVLKIRAYSIVCSTIWFIQFPVGKNLSSEPSEISRFLKSTSAIDNIHRRGFTEIVLILSSAHESILMITTPF